MIKKLILSILFSTACLAVDWGQFKIDQDQNKIADAIEEAIKSNDIKSLANFPDEFMFLLDPVANNVSRNVYYGPTPPLRLALRESSAECVRYLIETKKVNASLPFIREFNEPTSPPETYIDILISEKKAMIKKMGVDDFQEKLNILLKNDAHISEHMRSHIETLDGPEGIFLRQTLGITISPASSPNSTASNSPRSSTSSGSDNDSNTNSSTQKTKASNPTQDTAQSNTADDATISSSGNYGKLKFVGFCALALAVLYGLNRASEEEDKKDDEDNERVV